MYNIEKKIEIQNSLKPSKKVFQIFMFNKLLLFYLFKLRFIIICCQGCQVSYDELLIIIFTI